MEILTYIALPIYLILLGYILTRLSGKKAVSQMHSYDLVFVTVLGSAISEPIAQDSAWKATWYSLAVVLFYLLLSRLILINKIKSALTATPTVLIRGGDIDKDGLKSVKMTIEELLGELRIKGFVNPAEIDIALMEETGKVSVIPKVNNPDKQSSDPEFTPKPAFVSIPIIIDGEILHHNLKFVNRDENWLFDQLQHWGIRKQDIKHVTLAVFTQDGSLQVDNDNTHDHEKGINNYKPGNEN
ncbi:DUF421 domain-containing protein [Domibacillus sp. PGB-M46]|uniref:DUF421 domain-containing protein n=1 Tax=Domibacillus sp. PGB-M46 TaxID=2910255 RepID=UPI001F577707|nr:DUF421 domain-containing protein [Domibacillus sp. PGB-M46]MCI2257276.1 DUF421 domain-containing protein [Domibacillus sp. PGB-M46]